MRSKSTRLVILSAWLLATGVQWDAVQVFAWARMFATNASVLPWRDALELTFSADGMCGACHVVQDAKQTESENTPKAVTVAAKEPVLFQSPAAIIVTVPTAHPWVVHETGSVAHERARPPTPPPRVVS